MCVGSRAVAGGSLQEWLSVRHLGLDHAQTGSGPQLIADKRALVNAQGTDMPYSILIQYSGPASKS